ncbi:type ISP restriction/modification enzyme [Methylophilus aquaticus]|uniref:site-specific DNA-methyltransferase (adenine-specific) n=1 Tax=Methylophilus aquaticus TaxID=1971610 RepID=A0ABT9JVT9_9PROT|nr:type ISP restriction/modification enzyme [Methylophilus aquaticus]MDP8568710.1 type ISP restriction/modification enzyme [Methylophilus aquaticus]
MTLNDYIQIVNQRYQAGNATEHSYRGDLQNLLQALLPNVDITNEPKRIGCGAPDYIISRKGKDIPIGYIEAKDVVEDINAKKHQAQFERYKAALDNLIITDYLQFQFYKDGKLIETIKIAQFNNGTIQALSQNFERFQALVQNFALVVTQSIKSPTKLAAMMAAKAKLMAQVIFDALQQDDEQQQNSELQAQREAFKNILIHDIDNAQFADIYAQTIAYGLFAARYHDPTLPTFSREEAATLIPKSNPFLRKLFQTVATYSLDDNVGERLLWIVEELVQVFLATDVAKIMQSFGKSTRQQDPIVHFYETFLAEYDPKLRKARGVWYTPEPVVDFIVRAVDDILKTKFNLPQGLADTSKITREIESIEPGSKGKPVKKTKTFHRVQILDPATGTGTFLAKTVEHIYQNNFASMQGMWPAYVKEHLIPRLNGFELLMTSYAMAHLKLDMLLTQTGYQAENNNERFQIYLTNSLEEHHPDTGTLFASWLSSEANEANHIKRDAPVMVVIGNPPYSVSSSNKSDWIQNLLKDYKKDLNERNIQPLSDDYIKFIRFGQHFIDKNGEGVLAYISNNSFIDGLIHRQMRKHLLESFDEIYILDLHGNAKKKETAPDGSKDENVFDIMQGVSINLFVKHNAVIPAKAGSQVEPEQTPKMDSRLRENDDAETKPLAKVFHHSLYGKREAKYEALNAGGFETLPWQEISYKTPEFLFIQKDAEVEQAYKQGFSINELFPLNSSGISTHRDHFVVDMHKEKLAQRIQHFYDLSVSDDAIKNEVALKDNRDWQLSSARKSSKFDDHLIKTVTYRPFDNQFIYYDGNLIDFGRQKVMQHLLAGENFAFVCLRQSRNMEQGTFFITKDLVIKDTISLLDRCSTFPLYTYPDSTDLLAKTTRTPNLNMQIVNTIAQGLGLTFTTEKTSPVIPAKAGIHVELKQNQKMDSHFHGNDEQTFAPIDLLDYIYAVLHSPRYRETYKEFLKIDFPRVPYPNNTETFWQLVALGSELRKTHLLETAANSTMIYPVSGNHVVGKLRYEDSKVYINETQYFDHVPALAWNFYIGGYQPAQKWLKDRKDRTLTREDIQHYQRIIHALCETDRLMQAVDKVFEV